MELSKVGEDGCTKKAHLLQFFKSTGELPPELANAPELDWRVEPIYHAFQKLCFRRQATPFGMGGLIYQALSAKEILDYETLERNKLSPFALTAIERLDGLFLEHKNKEVARASEKGTNNDPKGRKK